MRNQTEENQQPERPFARRYSSQDRRRYLTKNLWTDIIFWMCLIAVMVALGYGVVQLIRWLTNDVELAYIPRRSSSKYGDLLEPETTDAKGLQQWTNLIDDQLIDYRKPFESECNMVDCARSNYVKGDDETCAVNLTALNPCVNTNHYGYDRYSPCVLLRLLKTQNWNPEYYEDDDELPQDMPEDVKTRIKLTKDLNLDNNENPPEELKTRIKVVQSSNQKLKLRMVWLSCGPTLSTTASEMGSITFHPQAGFPEYYFPQDETCSRPPLVAIQFERFPQDTVINIRCKAWAKNLKASVSFKFRVPK